MVEDVRMNFKEKYKPNLVCFSCKLCECNQEHLLECQSLIVSNQLVSYQPDYEDIFDDEDPMDQFTLQTF